MTSHAPSNLPLPRSPISAVSQAAAQQAPGVAHGVLTLHAGPIRQWRARDNDRAEKLGPHGCDQHDCPAGLTIPNHRGLALGLRMKRDHALKKGRLGAGDVLDRLPRHGVGQEPDEVAGVAGLQGHADFALRLEPANARAVAGSGIDDDERTLIFVGLLAFGGTMRTSA